MNKNKTPLLILGSVLLAGSLLGCGSTTLRVDHTYDPEPNERFTFGTTPCLEEAEQKAKAQLGVDDVEIVRSDESIVIDMQKKGAVVECFVEVNKPTG